MAQSIDKRERFAKRLTRVSVAFAKAKYEGDKAVELRSGKLLHRLILQGEKAKYLRRQSKVVGEAGYRLLEWNPPYAVRPSRD